MKFCNYRGIMLLPYSEEIIGKYQCGFRNGRSTVDQIFIMKQTMEKCHEYNTDLHILFIDFQQAFDSINRDKIKAALLKLRIARKLTNLAMLTMKHSNAKVLIQEKLSNEFAVKSDVRQGDALSALIFHMLLQNAMGQILSYQIVPYAEDIAVISKNYRNMAEVFVTLEQNVNEIGLKINEEKTKYLKMSRDERRRNPQKITIGEYNFEGVNTFNYLGVIIRSDNSMHMCIKNEIQAANRSYYAYKKLLQNKLLSRQTKLVIYKIIIRPVVTYGCEVRTLTTTDENQLCIFNEKY